MRTMHDDPADAILIAGAREHNLRGVDVSIPHGAITVITGVSGSGKSSLAFDTLFREGQRRYLESLSSGARRALGKLERPAVDRIDGLGPAIAVDQSAVVRSPRSTVGTLTGLYDHLRLVFSRFAQRRCTNCNSPIDAVFSPGISRGCPSCGADFQDTTSTLLSFNTPLGACPACSGLGVQDRVDPDLLVADPSRSLRQGALVPTTPSGYIVYSQVTVDVLDRVCRAHGFSVDVPWNRLSDEQRHVVLYGSDRIVVPYGKHPLESRMRWTGITARPRQEGTYKGIVPTIEAIVARSRNRNALRFVRTTTCDACGGARLAPRSLSLLLDGDHIGAWAALSIGDAGRRLRRALGGVPAAEEVVRAFTERAALIADLGLDHLRLDRGSPTLSAGEVQRLKLATQIGSGLRGLVVVLDEPSVGLHGRDMARLMSALHRLRDLGNDVVLVEHDPAAIRAADHLIDIGPGAGARGGRLLYSGPVDGLLDPSSSTAPGSATRTCMMDAEEPRRDRRRRPGTSTLWLRGCRARNLRGIHVPLKLGAINAVTGVSGAGKSTLVDHVLGRALRRSLHGATARPGAHDAIEGAEALDKVIVVDQAPIGRNPRSNPATYTKLYDAVRDVFAATDEARERGWGRSHFSLNTKGGRCERCTGAGVETVGMHFLGDVAVTCSACGGRRFDEETLRVRVRGHSILDVLRMSVEDATPLLDGHRAARRILDALRSVGLGYLPLGQPSTTLSGGEAQRIKLARELGRPGTGRTLFILDEPTRGLHMADVEVLLDALEQLVQRGNSVVVVEHDPLVIQAADWVVDLGPEGGDGGGELLVAGTPEAVMSCPESLTGAVLRGEMAPPARRGPRHRPGEEPPIVLRGVTTHNLRDLDIHIPAGRLVAVAGVSGSGKSSLALDTLAEECRARFAECLPSRARRRAGRASAARLASAEGLTPVITIEAPRRTAARNPRSTLGTMTEVLERLRLLWARGGTPSTTTLLSAHFSFNDHRGACPACDGLGTVSRCDPGRLVTDPSASLLDGALDGTRTGRYYGERDGRYVAVLAEVGRQLGLPFQQPWEALDADARRVAMRGAGDRLFDVSWNYRRGRRSGTHRFEGTWDGFATYVEREYDRKHADRRGAALRPLMVDRVCAACGGTRLNDDARAVRVAGRTLPQVTSLSVDDARSWIEELAAAPRRSGLDRRAAAVLAAVAPGILRRLTALQRLGLGHLALDRPAPSLSGGELQRARLAAQLGARLRGITYVLDEPTAGLHPRDRAALLAVLRDLRDAGNTVVVVEHDPGLVAAADHVIELGPGAGPDGGMLVAEGPPRTLASAPASRMATHLAGPRIERATPPADRPADAIAIRGATARNLCDIDVDIPLRRLSAVTGVSGAGKTTLLHQVLGPSIERGQPRGCRAVRGADAVAAVLRADGSGASGPGTTTVAAAVGALSPLQRLFARAPLSRERSWTARRFSLAARGGRCEVCGGTGQQRLEMGFLPEVVLPCEACGGARYGPRALEVRVGGRTIADVLAATVDEARLRLDLPRAVTAPLETAHRAGLGYLCLGQTLGSLSAGERRRLDLWRRLDGVDTTATLLLLDEPTVGLHPDDVSRLLDGLRALVREGATVVAVTHDLALIAGAHHVIDLGPEGGDGGGRVVATGPPAEIADHPTSHTGAALRRHLGDRGLSVVVEGH